LAVLLWAAGVRGPVIPAATEISPSPTPEVSIPHAVVVPVWMGNGRWICPLNWPYSAYAQGQVFYPPNHPDRPDLSVRPIACFGSPRAAGVGGYSRAAPPAGAEVVDDVYLVQTSAALRDECARAATTLGFAVPCPTRLPSVRSSTAPDPCAQTSFGAPMRPPCVYGSVRGGGQAFVLDLGAFDVPPGFHTQDPENPAHVVIVAFRSGRMDPAVVNVLGCPRSHVEDRVEIGGLAPGAVRALVALCDSGVPPLARTTVVAWVDQGTTFLVGVQGFTSTSRDLAMAVAGSIRYMPPAG
jgi:hypothetical protein